MYLSAIFALVAATIAYMVLQSIESKKQGAQGSRAKNAALFFFLLLVFLVLFYLLGIGTSNKKSGGVLSLGGKGDPLTTAPPMIAKDVLAANMLKQIREDVTVGAAPF
jgi:hypothetical protein